MHFIRSGAGTPALVFVHGFACSHQDWQAQLDAFSSTHEVVACDLRGHGATPGRPHECSIEHYGGDVAALLENLGLKAILVGHSMGCRVVLEANRLAPERVAGIVLIDGSRQGVGDPDAAQANAAAAIEAKGGYAAFMRPFFEAMFLEQTAQSQAVVERALRLPADIGAALFPRQVRWDAERMEAALEAVRAPVMAIQATYVNTERKRVPLAAGGTTPWLDLVREKVKDARIEILAGLGHFPQLEAPDRVNRLISEFLAARR